MYNTSGNDEISYQFSRYEVLLMYFETIAKTFQALWIYCTKLSLSNFTYSDAPLSLAACVGPLEMVKIET